MATLPRILLAPDKFKGSLSAAEVCAALTGGITSVLAKAEIKTLPLADGGDGTLDILSTYLSLVDHKVETVDPLGRPISATYLADANRAFIEIASASGLVLLEKVDRNPMHTSTYGTGLMVKDALAKGKTEIYLLLGGSATNDMGLGIASALGIQFEGTGKVAISGSDLNCITSVSLSAKPDLTDANFTLLCDVTNTAFGPNGTAHVYAKQKGANEVEIEQLDQGLRHATSVLQKHTTIDLANLKGGGAAGAIGIAMVALFDAKLQPGFAAISELTNVEAQIQWADLVITGEGQIDSQSLQGKVVGNIVELCLKYDKPCHVVVGHNALPLHEPLPQGISSISALTDIEADVEVCMKEGARLVESVGAYLASHF